jgi:hypothetical protein
MSGPNKLFGYGAIASAGQVIYLTQHQHLRAVARTVGPGVTFWGAVGAAQYRFLAAARPGSSAAGNSLYASVLKFGLPQTGRLCYARRLEIV